MVERSLRMQGSNVRRRCPAAVHRLDIAEAERCKRSSNERDVFDMLMQEHVGCYSEARPPRAVESATPGPPVTADTGRDRAAAAKHQAALLEQALEECPDDRRSANPSATNSAACPEGAARPLLPDEVPRSPKEMAAELNAKSGCRGTKNSIG